MAEKEIILQGEDGQVDELVLTTQDQASCNSLEDCVRMLFPQEGEKKPRLRFKGFEGDWVTTKLCQISKKVTTKNTDLKYRTTLTNSAEMGIVNQLDYFDHDVSNGDNISGYYVVENDDFVYNPRISATAPVGPINRNQLGYAGVMSLLYYVFRVDGIDKDYLSYFFKTTLWHKYMFDNGNNGARYDRFSIADEVFGQMPIIHPKDIEEQRQIASLLKRLDTQIEHYQQQFDQLKQLKSACLETMFPKQDETIPALRFKGFDGEWNEKSIEDFCYSQPSSLTQESLKNLDGPYPVFGASGFIKNIDTFRQKEPYIGVVKDGAGVGRVGLYPAYSSILGTMHYVLPKEGCDISFLASLLETIDLAKISSGSTIPHIYFKDYKGKKIHAPSLVEQEKIASFFRLLDEQIASQQQQLERLKKMKQSCLGLLFADNQSITPPLRFKGFNGEWLIYSYDDVFTIVNDSKSNISKTNYLSMGKYPVIDQSKEFIVGYTNQGNPLVPTDGYIIFGDHTREFKYVDFPFYTGADGTQILNCKNAEQDSLFVYYLCLSLNIPNTGYNRHLKYLKESTFAIPPTIEEQRRIASFFRSVDKQIETQSQQVEKLKQVKKACLNQFIA